MVSGWQDWVRTPCLQSDFFPVLFFDHGHIHGNRRGWKFGCIPDDRRICPFSPLFHFRQRHFCPAGEYARIIFAGTLIIFFGQVASAILRGEGDVKRAMTVMMISSGLNIILDPIFIYLLKWGVAGAAWATLVSICFSSGYLFFWFFIKRDTYVSIKFRAFRFKKAILSEIVKVGIPASFQQITMSISMLILNLIAVKAGGTDGAAIFTTGWRVVLFATLPLYGIGTAVVSVTGAAFGGKAYKKLDTGYMYAIKFGVAIELIMAVITFILAPQIAWLLTFTQESIRIRAELINFLRIMCIFYPAVSPGMLSSAMFQGTGKGSLSCRYIHPNPSPVGPAGLLFFLYSRPPTHRPLVGSCPR